MCMWCVWGVCVWNGVGVCDATCVCYVVCACDAVWVYLLREKRDWGLCLPPLSSPISSVPVCLGDFPLPLLAEGRNLTLALAGVCLSTYSVSQSRRAISCTMSHAIPKLFSAVLINVLMQKKAFPVCHPRRAEFKNMAYVYLYLGQKYSQMILCDAKLSPIRSTCAWDWGYRLSHHTTTLIFLIFWHLRHSDRSS